MTKRWGEKMELFASVARVRERQTCAMGELALLGHLSVFKLATCWILVPATERLTKQTLGLTSYARTSKQFGSGLKLFVHFELPQQ